MAVSIKDIAETAGVSHSTVSRILRSSEKFSYSPETIKRIQKIAREMGYKPNFAAKFMKTGKSNTIGITTGTEYSYARYNLIQNCAFCIREHGYTPLLVDINNLNNENSFSGIMEYVDGLLCFFEHYEKQVVKYCNKYSIDLPIVSFVNKTKSDSKVKYIVNNSLSAIEQSLTHLQDLGHKNIAYVGYDMMEDRTDAFIKQCRIMKLKGKYFSVKAGKRNNSYLSGSSIAKDIVKSEKITAVVCEDDEFAMGIISGLNDMGKKVPDDFSIIGFDDLPFASVTIPKLTTVRFRNEEAASIASELLISTIEDWQAGSKKKSKPLSVDCKLVLRQSTGKVSK